MKKICLKITIILLTMSCLQAFAQIDGSIECSISRQDKSFLIKNSSITFYRTRIENVRTIASLSHVRTKLTNSGFTKITSYEGHKYTFHINNLENFTDKDDFVEIRSRQGHNIIYPITCRYN